MLQPIIELQLGRDRMITNRAKNRFLVNNTRLLRKGNETLLRWKMICPGKRWPKSRTERYALLMDVLTRSIKAECAKGTGKGPNDAAAKGAQIKPRKEEYALGMEQSGQGNNAAVQDAQM